MGTKLVGLTEEFVRKVDPATLGRVIQRYVAEEEVEAFFIDRGEPFRLPCLDDIVLGLAEPPKPRVVGIRSKRRGVRE